jgi:hypothetical protein
VPPFRRCPAHDALIGSDDVDVEVVASLAKGSTAYADDVSLIRN